MKYRNCPNCGAAYSNETVKCPYCGTLYYDLSTIPLNTPFLLTINVGTKEFPKIVTSKVICTQANMTNSVDVLPVDFACNGIAMGTVPKVIFNLEFQSLETVFWKKLNKKPIDKP